MANKKSFFLISFLPAIAYMLLEEFYSLQVALIGGLVLAVIEISLEKILTKHVHSISKFNFYLIAVLGGIALIGQDGIWFKLQPFFTGILMGGYLLVRVLQNNGLLLETMESFGQAIPNKKIMRSLERDLSIFMILYGLFMAYVAFELTTKQWVFYKTIGFYLSSLVFFILEFVLLRIQMRREIKKIRSKNAK
ncbi:MAG: hypothetical protein CME62_10810 [Halobacteriovoraceae bacterium]|nr:hypothetical protein [Halobacteriovoraceae bacterium]|tara:strand:- start:6661 stop:7239 length:579 start_codon:yes stop_codon:yes gene_type:complete